MEKYPLAKQYQACYIVETCAPVVCNNRFRVYLNNLFDIESASFVKTGHMRKFTQKGVLRMKSNRNTEDQVYLQFKYMNRVLELKRVTSEEARKLEELTMTKMFFGNANHRTSFESIISYFAGFGTILYGQLMRNIAQDGTRFGFIIFEDRQSLLDVYSNAHPHLIDGKILKVCDYVNARQNRTRKELYAYSEPPSGIISLSTLKQNKCPSEPADSTSSLNHFQSCLRPNQSKIDHSPLSPRFDRPIQNSLLLNHQSENIRLNLMLKR